MQAIMSIVDREAEWSSPQSESSTVKRQPKSKQQKPEIDPESKLKIENYITQTRKQQKMQKKEIENLKEELELERENIHEKIEILEELYKGKIGELESELTGKEELLSKNEKIIIELREKVKKLEVKNKSLEKSQKKKEMKNRKKHLSDYLDTFTRLEERMRKREERKGPFCPRRRRERTSVTAAEAVERYAEAVAERLMPTRISVATTSGRNRMMDGIAMRVGQR